MWMQVLIASLIERGRKSLDSKYYRDAGLGDLSKTFDTLNHNFLLA